MKTTTHTLVKTETNRKANKYSYAIVINETGETVGTRNSNREYVACTIDGAFFFGRMDLVGKGDHGKMIKHCQAEAPKAEPGRKDYLEAKLTNLTTIAVLK